MAILIDIFIFLLGMLVGVALMASVSAGAYRKGREDTLREVGYDD